MPQSTEPSLDGARRAIAPLYRRAEPDALEALAERARLTPAGRARVAGRAGALLAELRAPGRGGWIDRFLAEYSLSSDEGAALLGLAEAYLRFLYTDAAQELAARKHFRPRSAAVAARYAAKFPPMNLVTIASFGGWRKAQNQNFVDGGSFDKIYQPR